MNIQDLEKFLVIAKTQNLQQAAEILDTSPSVLSKSLKRLESSLATSLFDRVGKNIQLNPSGELLRTKAAQIVSHAKQTLAEFSGMASTNNYRIAGPSLLMLRWASVITRCILASEPNALIRFESVYEQQALNQVVNGNADLGLITSAIAPQLPEGMFSYKLGEISMQVAASRNHPLVTSLENSSFEVSLEQLLQYSFASPSISPYCGESRGVGCDGWQNQLFPRKLQMVVNDYSVLSQLVRSGQALAYMPDYWLRELELIQLKVVDCPYQCVESLQLVSWQEDLVNKLGAI